jgi:(p)ppGpp synthase/HD superfamily hydrolase
MTSTRTHLTPRYTEAVGYAVAVHATQIRKGTGIPYAAHLLGVSSLVLEAGGDEDQAIAGLLHDAVEDAGGLARLADIRARFGDEVADIVLACSDSTDPAWKAATPYDERKRLYLERLAREPDRVVLVSIADKVHNARAIATDLAVHGRQTLERFTGTEAQILHYYRTCADIADQRRMPMTLTVPLRAAIAAIEAALDGPVHTEHEHL